MYCEICRRSQCSSGMGFFGKMFKGKVYCHQCYPLAIEHYIAEEKLKEFEKEKQND